jgi:signal transduction histidine kinase
VLAAFGVAFVLLSAGAWTVYRAGVRHRATADETLRDHASYIANMIASTVYSQGWFSVQTLLHAWKESLDGHGPWPATDSVTARASRESLEPDMALLSPVAYVTGSGSEWHATNPELAVGDPALRNATRELADSLPSDSRFRLLFEPDGADTLVVFAMGLPKATATARWYGVVIPLADLRDKLMEPRISTLAHSFSYLKDSLKQTPFTDSLPPLAIRIEAPNHRVLYATPDAPHEPWLGSYMMRGDLPANVIVSVEPAAVPVLMSYGYPTDTPGRVLVAWLGGLLLLGAAAIMAWRALSLSRQREEFTSSVSHELRTPLTNIQLFAETLLLDRARTAEERQSALETITRETRRLVHMVENVLALSRVGHPSNTVVPRPERIDRLVRDVLASFEPLLRSRNIDVEIALEGPDTAAVDGDAVRRILVNLLDNAVRYGPDGQTLRIMTAHRGERLELVVEDEGPGVPAADRERIWRPFERGTAEVTGGTGIGLAVVRQLVTLHGGHASVEAGRRGARFVVVLPIPQSDAA